MISEILTNSTVEWLKASDNPLVNQALRLLLHDNFIPDSYQIEIPQISDKVGRVELLSMAANLNVRIIFENEPLIDLHSLYLDHVSKQTGLAEKVELNRLVFVNNQNVNDQSLMIAQLLELQRKDGGWLYAPILCWKDFLKFIMTGEASFKRAEKMYNMTVKSCPVTTMYCLRFLIDTGIDDKSIVEKGTKFIADEYVKTGGLKSADFTRNPVRVKNIGPGDYLELDLVDLLNLFSSSGFLNQYHGIVAKLTNRLYNLSNENGYWTNCIIKKPSRVLNSEDIDRVVTLRVIKALQNLVKP